MRSRWWRASGYEVARGPEYRLQPKAGATITEYDPFADRRKLLADLLGIWARFRAVGNRCDAAPARFNKGRGVPRGSDLRREDEAALVKWARSWGLFGLLPFEAVQVDGDQILMRPWPEAAVLLDPEPRLVTFDTSASPTSRESLWFTAADYFGDGRALTPRSWTPPQAFLDWQPPAPPGPAFWQDYGEGCEDIAYYAMRLSDLANELHSQLAPAASWTLADLVRDWDFRPERACNGKVYLMLQTRSLVEVIGLALTVAVFEGELLQCSRCNTWFQARSGQQLGRSPVYCSTRCGSAARMKRRYKPKSPAPKGRKSGPKGGDKA